MSGDSHIDEALLQRARDGDRQAHAALYRAFAPMVFTLAYRMLGSRAAAEDVLQDSFVEVIRNAAAFRGDGGVAGWIKRIAINKALSHLRSPWVSRRTGAVDGIDAWQGRKLAEDAAERSGRSDDQAYRLGRQQELAHALAALSATARAVVWLHGVEGYTHQEIGRLMGRSTSFSKTQLSRAYGELRERLDPMDGGEEAEPCLGVLKTV
ncbi:MAG TPA: RNA polymerase sigma factor [Gammaproteobacteria bacterium]|nr:RNA polymerase sigma factor [Gammaproteobacteria bacterium]